MKLTKDNKRKVDEIIISIYSGVVMQLDPTSSTYKEISNRLSSDLAELRAALGMVK